MVRGSSPLRRVKKCFSQARAGMDDRDWNCRLLWSTRSLPQTMRNWLLERDRSAGCCCRRSCICTPRKILAQSSGLVQFNPEDRSLAGSARHTAQKSKRKHRYGYLPVQAPEFVPVWRTSSVRHNEQGKMAARRACRKRRCRNEPWSRVLTYTLEIMLGQLDQHRAGSPTISGCRASATAGETQITSACAPKIAAAR